MLALLLAWLLGVRSWDLALSVAVFGVGMIALVGWRDDRQPLAPGARLAAQFVAGLCLVPLALSPVPVPAWMHWGAVAWWVLWGVSAVNVVNFMDGIDGLIGGQMCVFGVHLALFGGPEGMARPLGLAMTGACAGFLFWNWSPARIFMGDAGSGGLGLTAVLGGLLLLREGGAGLVAAFLPLYQIFLDATITLLGRAIRGERLTQAHRDNLYQRLANGGWGHARVSLLYAACSVLGVSVAQAMTQPLLSWGILGYLVLVLALGSVLNSTAPLSVRSHP